MALLVDSTDRLDANVTTDIQTVKQIGTSEIKRFSQSLSTTNGMEGNVRDRTDSGRWSSRFSVIHTTNRLKPELLPDFNTPPKLAQSFSAPLFQ
jgi:hypothetical protein